MVTSGIRFEIAEKQAKLFSIANEIKSQVNVLISLCSRFDDEDITDTYLFSHDEMTMADMSEAIGSLIVYLTTKGKCVLTNCGIGDGRQHYWNYSYKMGDGSFITITSSDNQSTQLYTLFVDIFFKDGQEV